MLSTKITHGKTDPGTPNRATALINPIPSILVWRKIRVKFFAPGKLRQFGRAFFGPSWHCIDRPVFAVDVTGMCWGAVGRGWNLKKWLVFSKMTPGCFQNGLVFAKRSRCVFQKPLVFSKRSRFGWGVLRAIFWKSGNWRSLGRSCAASLSFVEPMKPPRSRRTPRQITTKNTKMHKNF